MTKSNKRINSSTLALVLTSVALVGLLVSFFVERHHGFEEDNGLVSSGTRSLAAIDSIVGNSTVLTDDGPSACELNHSTCAAVTANCGLGTGASQLFDYYHLHYCVLGDLKALSFVILFVWLFLVFSLLASTADNFFVVQLETMSAELKLSPTTAGITLLALGNSSPDVFSDLAAVKGADDFALAIGELMGASMFLTTVVLGSVILFSHVGEKDRSDGSDAPTKCEVDKVPFIRDVGAFIVALLMILIISLTQGSITTAEGGMIIAIYVVYVFGVILSTYVDIPGFFRRMFGGSKENETTAKRDLHRMGSMLHTDDHLSRRLIDMERTISKDRRHSDYSDALLDNDSEDDDENDSAMVGVTWDPEEGFLGKVQYVLEFPFSLLRWLSIPTADKKWGFQRRIFSSLAPMGVVCSVFLAFSQDWCPDCNTALDAFVQPISNGSKVPMIIAPLVGAAIFGIVIFFCTTNETLPKWHMLLVVMAFLSTISWLDIIGNECVALLEALGTILGITQTKRGHSILGITVLSWANSIGDFVADTAVARAGKPKMGVSSVFGSPLLTACLGLGFATVIASASTGSVASHINGEIRMSYAFLAVSLFSSLILIPIRKFTLPRAYAFYLFGVYVCYMILSILVVLGIV